ncbi:MAG: DsbA family protein [Candidatus Limnocylindrales bacterium]
MLRSPTVLITAGVAVVAVLALAFVLVQNVVNGSSGPIVAPAETLPLSLAHGRSIGNPNAPIKLDEWADFQCSVCDDYSLTVEPDLMRQYVATGQVQITYHDMLIIGPASLTAAVAARCAGEQGQFWPYHDYLFANQGPENGGRFNRALYDAIAAKLNLNQSAFDQCLANPAIAQAAEAETTQGEQLGIAGTPTIFMNGKLLYGSLVGPSGSPAAQSSVALTVPSFSAAIDAELRALASAAPSSATPSASSSPGPSVSSSAP